MMKLGGQEILVSNRVTTIVAIAATTLGATPTTISSQGTRQIIPTRTTLEILHQLATYLEGGLPEELEAAPGVTTCSEEEPLEGE